MSVGPVRGTAVAASRALRIVLVLVAVLATVLLPAAPASAHAQLLSSDPADGATLASAPSRLTLTFDEPVSAVPDGTLLLGGADPGSGTTLVATARDAVVTVLLPALETDARYLVTWRVVSADGHPIAGSIAFAIGDPPAGATAPTTSEVAASARIGVPVVALNGGWYVGLLALAGIALFEGLVLRGTAPAPALRRASRIAGIGAAGTAALLVPFTAAANGTAGLAAPTAAAALAILAAVLTWLPRTRLVRIVAPSAALLALLSPTLGGHTVSRPPAWLVIGGDAVHLVAGAVWFGGLVALCVQLRAERRAAAASRRRAAAIVARYSTCALAAVALLGASGVLMAVLILPDPASLVESAFGRTLLVKLGLVAVAIGLAAAARVRARRLVVAHTPVGVPVDRSIGRREDDPDDDAGDAAWRRLRVFLLREAAVLVAVIACTGLLVTASPVAASPQPASFAAAADDVRVTGAVLARGTDGTDVAFAVLAEDGSPLVPAEPPSVSVEPAAGSDAHRIGPLPGTVVTDGGPGRYRAETPTPAAGRWTMTIGIRLDAFTQRTLRVEIAVP